MVNMTIIIQVKPSVCWLSVYTCAEYSAILCNMFIPRKGRVLSIAVSMVKFKEGCFEFKTSRKEVAAWGLGMIVNVSSTYHL